MEWQIIIAVLIVIPVILFPVTLMWYLNLGDINTAFKEFKSRRTLREKEG